MGDSTPKPTPKYTALHTTALTFLHAQRHDPSLPTPMDFSTLRRLVTPTYTHAFGPTFFTSQTPKLQGDFSIEAWIEHLGGMIPKLDTWDVDVKGVVVDEMREEVVVRVVYGMQVKGVRVESEVTWWLEMEERKGDEGWMLRRSREVVDATAAGKIRELMVAD